MVDMTIPQMNQHLESINQFFIQQTIQFKTKITQHSTRFNISDQKQFQVLLKQIKNYATTKITAFFNDKISLKQQVYKSYINQYTKNSQSVQNSISKFRKQLEVATLEMKEEQNRKQNLMEHLSKKYSTNIVLKKTLKILKDYQRQRKLAKALDHKMDMIYGKNLLKKAFFPWRTLTYKDGYANTVRRQIQRDIASIHDQYQSIIAILKKKISQTEQIIKVKKAAKGQFAYAMSKNLLKTISNLSLEVMSLNQMSLKDGQWSQDSTVKFMEEVDLVIKEKLSKVRQYRTGLVQEGQFVGQEGQNKAQQKKKKHISFA